MGTDRVEPTGRLLTCKEFARRVGIQVPTVYKMVRNGRIPYARVGHKIMIPYTALRVYKQDRAKPFRNYMSQMRAKISFYKRKLKRLIRICEEPFSEGKAHSRKTHEKQTEVTLDVGSHDHGRGDDAGDGEPVTEPVTGNHG